MSADLVLHDEPPETRDRILGLASAALSGCTRVRLAWAFGSFVEGRRFRDLDIAVQIYGIPEWIVPVVDSDRIHAALGDRTDLRDFAAWLAARDGTGEGPRRQPAS